MKRMKFFKDMLIGIFTVIGLLFFIKMIMEAQEEIKDEENGEPIGI